ncbi:hypothetical protein, partial [Escherichia coli]|uniref:hypothetical protein n=1 Tax=Escherichia coli TaxID=562 RepID=UPI0008FF28A4
LALSRAFSSYSPTLTKVILRISDLHVLTINTKYMSELSLQPKLYSVQYAITKKNRSAKTPRFFLTERL